MATTTPGWNYPQPGTRRCRRVTCPVHGIGRRARAHRRAAANAREANFVAFFAHQAELARIERKKRLLAQSYSGPGRPGPELRAWLDANQDAAVRAMTEAMAADLRYYYGYATALHTELPGGIA
ncbi:hypothetical protein J3996_gp88 [Mycobacterium phage Laurie]|uniref:Uncharacterized protein n=1 Tax=Mycobacterium phage Laurie TaxID=1874015 RepID=A0A1B2IHS9_9CAUD|nr:hypothetical protein J3996_gp88 [Mycobacterium phage Laurie]ANZ52382.1 hypothetical protein SEA_LAURIE_88 [Mycobacterium phage Laurie]